MEGFVFNSSSPTFQSLLQIIPKSITPSLVKRGLFSFLSILIFIGLNNSHKFAKSIYRGRFDEQLLKIESTMVEGFRKEQLKLYSAKYCTLMPRNDMF